MEIRKKVITNNTDLTKLLGSFIKVYLNGRINDKAAFHFKVTGCGPGYLYGLDVETFIIAVDIEDIEFITGSDI